MHCVVCLGTDREGVAVVWPQVHGPVWTRRRRPEGGVADIYTVHRVHLAAVRTVPVSLPVQRAVPTLFARPCHLLQVRHFHRQLREGSTGLKVNILVLRFLKFQ